MNKPVQSVTASSSVGRPAARSLEDVLAQSGLLTEEALQRAHAIQAQSGEPVETVVTRLGLVSEEQLAAAVTRATGLRALGRGDFPTSPVEGRLLSPAFLRDRQAVPVALADNEVTVAVANPFAEDALSAIAFAFGRPARPVIARATDITAAIDSLYIQSPAATNTDQSVDTDDLDRLRDLVSDAPVIRAVNRIIARAVDNGASDIHMEPTDDSLTVRLRVDGVLRREVALPAALRAPLVSRLKVMAGLNIAERRLPQDGRLRIAVRGEEIDFRIATSPTMHGEAVVLRILDKSKLPLDLGALGFDPATSEGFRAAINRPHGIVLVTGPTGSGKTTTLYAALNELNTVSRKILTVEDPIEYRLPGIVQTQVNPGIQLTFGTALRSFLRQDPDVMMVGEIRDIETAEIAVQAALTGHMILSTLHTNTAAGAVTRLLDMGVESFLLSSVLAGVVAQRLVRRLCPHCREALDTPAELTAQLGEEAAAFLGPVIYRAHGCDHCHGIGFQGRVAVVEFLPVSPAIEQLILQRADMRGIVEQARAEGMRTMVMDGLTKVAQGLTTVEEVLRVAIED